MTVSGLSLTGADAGNYTITDASGAAATITAKPITVTATGVNKVYDNTAVATVTLSDDRIAGDNITDSYTAASFADKNVGNNKTVSVSGISISGADAGNYTLSSTIASTMANIIATPPSVLVSNLFVNQSQAFSEMATTYNGIYINPNQSFFFFYHSLEQIDASELDDIILDAGAYDFVDGVLKLNKTKAGVSSYLGL